MGNMNKPDRFGRTLLRPICWAIGHKQGWLRARVPNPYAIQSCVGGCVRCTKEEPF